MDIKIRQERQKDYQQIRDLVREAFARAEHSDGDEHNLIERIRLFPDYIPELSLVAESDDIILGHIMFSKNICGSNRGDRSGTTFRQDRLAKKRHRQIISCGGTSTGS